MRVWRIDASKSNKDLLLRSEGAPYGSMPEFDGNRLEKCGNDIPLERKRKLRNDLYTYDPAALIVSDKAHSVLAGCIEESAQCIKLDLDGQVAWLVNVTTVIDCLTSESDIVADSDRGFTWIRYVRQYELDETLVSGASLFKIKGIETKGCFCTDLIVSRIIEAGLKGFYFSLAFDSAVPPGRIRFERIIPIGDFYIESGKRGKACLPRENSEAFGQELVPLRKPTASAAERIEPSGPSTDEPEPAPYDGPALDDDIRAVREEALASLPGLPAAAGELSDGPCGALGSRVCGSPAMLPGEEWPEGPGGEPLCFLAQLDMADLPPLPGFPGKGLLRLFVGEGPEFGLDPSDMAAQAGFRALWAPDPEGAALRAAPEEAEDGLGWGDGPWAMRFAGPFESRPDDVDFRVEGAFAKLWNAAHPGLPVGRMHDDADRYASDPGLTWNLSSREGASAGGTPAVQVGGYPVFCQDDWRNWEERYRPYDTLLFQLSCDWDRWIAIGDGGRMCFLIPSEKLAAGDFSDIMYWWDCG